jgi:hypothetical protein
VSFKYHDRYAAVYSDKESARFAQWMGAAKRLRIRMLAFDNGYIDLDFDLSGAAEAIAKASEACR